jgi:hypothetical protein
MSTWKMVRSEELLIGAQDALQKCIARILDGSFRGADHPARGDHSLSQSAPHE